MRKSIYSLFLASILLIGSNTFGQGTNARISGKITGMAGTALPGASVLATNTSTGFKTGQTTNIEGKFDIRELPLGGPYTLTVTYVGFQEQKQEGINLNLSDHLTLNFTLKEGKDLEAVVILGGNNLMARTDRLGSALAITGKTIATIPTPTRNFEQLAFLSGQSYTPEVGQRNLGGFTLAGGKGGTGGFSVDGANTRNTMFGATQDGAAFTILQEAIREFEIETNDYGVRNGRNSGGVVKAVTKSGTNMLHGGAWYYAGGGKFSQTKSPVGAALSSVPKQGQYGFSLGGPIKKDKLFFFTVFDQYKTSQLTDPRTQLFLDYSNSTFPGGETEANTFYGYTKSDAQKAIDAAKAKGYDVGDGIGNLVKDATTTNYFARIDWNINNKNTFAIRYNYLKFDLTNEGNSGNALGLAAPQIPTSARIWGTNAGNYPFLNLAHRVTADLRSTISDKILNKLVLQYNTNSRANNPKEAVQEPRVYVGIPAANGLAGGTVAFGQLTWIPEMMKTNNFQIIDDVTYNADNGVTWTFGTNNQFYSQNERIAHWTAPVVSYANVDDLNADKPSFYRQLVSNSLQLKELQKWNFAEIGFYAEAAFNLNKDIKIETGLRYDLWKQYGTKPTANTALATSGLLWHGAALDNTAGLNYGVWQPRFNLTWDVTGDQRNIFKVGGGLFASPITTQAVTQSFYNDGVSTKRIDYVGNAAVMAALGKGNFADPSTWLSAKINPTGEKVPNTAANVIMMDPNFKMPSALRFNTSFTHFFSDKFKATLTGFNDTYWVNANRRIASVNPVDGREVMAVSNANFGNVTVHTNADWNSRYLAIQLDLYAKLGKDGLISFTYTKAKGSGVTTFHSGGTFEDAEFVGANYFDRFKGSFNNSYQNGVGDKVVLIVATPTIKGYTLGFSFMAAHQRRFNIVTTGDPNATTDRDLAYIPTLTQDLRTPLSNVAQEVMDVVKASEGQITGVYQGVYPWLYQTSMSLSKRFEFKKNHGITVRADLFNVLNFISPNAGYYKNINSSGDDFSAGRFINLFNWNAAVAGTPTTAAVPGYYSVDRTQGNYIRGGSPYQIQFGLKYDF